MAKAAIVDIPDFKYEEALKLRKDGKTKKVQCEALGIKYNTTRLEQLLTSYIENKATREAIREKKKTEAITDRDIARWVEDYVLGGRSVSDIAHSSFRSEGVVRYHLEKCGALFIRRGITGVPMLPDQAVSDTFEIGELVWVSSYGCMGEIRGQYKNAWRVYVFGDGVQEFTYQPAYDLGRLKYLEEMGVSLRRAYDICLTSEQCNALMAEALEKAFKNKTKGKS